MHNNIYECSFTAEINCTEGDIRLIGTVGHYNGDVIICHQNVWGYICGEMWDSNDGMVACHQLGFEFDSVTSNYNTRQERLINLVSNLNCSGSERRLTDCDSNIFGLNSCPSRKAGLVCVGK